ALSFPPGEDRTVPLPAPREERLQLPEVLFIQPSAQQPGMLRMDSDLIPDRLPQRREERLVPVDDLLGEEPLVCEGMLGEDPLAEGMDRRDRRGVEPAQRELDPGPRRLVQDPAGSVGDLGWRPLLLGKIEE